MDKEMNKESILIELQNLVRILKDNQDKLKEDAEFRTKWQEAQQELGIATKKLNSCDMSWLNDEYGKWYKKEILPAMANVDPSIKDKLEWQ